LKPPCYQKTTIARKATYPHAQTTGGAQSAILGAERERQRAQRETQRLQSAAR